MKKGEITRLIAMIAAFLTLTGVVSTRIGGNKEKHSKEEVSVEEEIVIEETPEPVIYKLYYDNDTVDVEEAINELGIVENNDCPYNCYKFIRYVDNDHYERYAIVNVYVDYVTDENKNITDTIYSYVDIFSGKLLLTTRDKKDVTEYDSDEILYLMETGSLLGLKESVISRGLDRDYANSVMSSDIKNITLSTYDVARYYVLLVNSKNRLDRGYVMSIG